METKGKSSKTRMQELDSGRHAQRAARPEVENIFRKMAKGNAGTYWVKLNSSLVNRFFASNMESRFSAGTLQSKTFPRGFVSRHLWFRDSGTILAQVVVNNAKRKAMVDIQRLSPIYSWNSDDYNKIFRADLDRIWAEKLKSKPRANTGEDEFKYIEEIFDNNKSVKTKGIMI